MQSDFIQSSPQQRETILSLGMDKGPVAAETSADFIIVGAGSSGCVLANRLSKHFSVLLLEAGGPEPPDSDLASSFDSCRQLQNTSLDWQLSTRPESQLAGRTISWPRGRGLGGSSLLNYMIYNRGAAALFDQWAAALEDPAWEYSQLLPKFKRSERNSEFAEPFHGTLGEMHVEPCPVQIPERELFLQGAEELGFGAKAEFDFNGERQAGVAGFYQHTVKAGRRWSARDAFLRDPGFRENLRISHSSLATQIKVVDQKASAVEYVTGEGRYVRAFAEKEIILCAGAVDSPKLLMLSGIGPADLLQDHGISVHRNCDAVGRNLSDHPVVQVVCRSRLNTPKGDIPMGGLFFSSNSDSKSLDKVADLQLHPYLFPARRQAMFCFGLTLVQPLSRGQIALASNSPLTKPQISANYLQQQEDLDALQAGLKTVLRLARSRGLSKIVRGGPLHFPDDSVPNLSRGIRDTLTTLFHPMGSCAMGTSQESVLDSRLRVRGMANLRVADASAIPLPVNANTHATCVMIGEQAADFLLFDHGANSLGGLSESHS